jgi:dihydrofolate synthase/folylpolyglutamate synthase
MSSRPRSGSSGDLPSYYAPPTPSIAYLYSLARNGPKLGLDRTRRLIAELGCPTGPAGVVTVAGTNGKGSTCRYLDRILRDRGHRTGLFTSPHLLRVNERVCVGGTEIPDGDLERLIDRIRTHSEADPVTYFEAIFGIAIRHFADCDVEWGVLEVGLGGRLDSTNALDADLALLSSVGLDHRAVLGPTEADILREKVDISRRGRPLAVGDLSDGLSAGLERFAADRGVPLARSGREWSWGWTRTDRVGGEAWEEGWVHWPGARRPIPIRVRGFGDFRVHNAALAAAGLRFAGLLPEEPRVLELDVPVPGRFEPLLDEPRVYADAAHNEPALRMIARNLRRLAPPERTRVVLGLMKDKEPGTALAELAGAAGSIVLTAPPLERAARPEDLRERFLRAGVPASRLRLVEEPASALDLCLKESGPADTLLVVGSHYMVAESYLYFGRAVRRPVRQEI